MTHNTDNLEQLKRAVLLRQLQQRGAARRASPASTDQPIPAADRSKPLALSFSQQRLWFLDQLDHEAAAAYHIPFALRLRGQLDRDALRAALDQLLVRHECLRARFPAKDGQAQQVFAPVDGGFLLEEQDLTAMPKEERESDVAVRRAIEAATPFDLATGPVIRGHLLRLAEDEHVLLMSLHHIVSDGWSVGILVRDLGALYEAFSQGRPDPLAPLSVQYADYAAWQRERLDGPAQSTQLAFWQAHLSGAPELLQLPWDGPRPSAQSHAGARHVFALSDALSAELRELGRRHGVTLFMTMLAAWSVLMSKLSGQDDVVIGTVTANRQHRDVEPLIGFFTNTLALRVRLDANPTVEQLLTQVRQTTLDAHEHQDLPFEQVVEALHPVRGAGHSPLFQVALSLDNNPSAALALPGLSIEREQHQANISHYDLHLDLRDTGGVIEATLTYATDLFSAGTVARFADHFKNLLAAMARDDQARVSRLPLLNAQQRQQLLVEFNNTDAAFPRERLMHELVQAHASARPDAIAVVFGEQQLTYDQLNRRANQLAHRLLELGVRPDDRVAICIERGLDFIVAVLGTLKAGAAFVPLDPAYPTERLAHMLEDCAPAVLLTEQKLASSLPGGGLVLLLDALPAGHYLELDPDARALGLTPSKLAYIIYTSGSTGLPKGVMIEHLGLINLISGQIAAFGIEPDSRLLQFASISFDASVSEIATALCAGATLCLASRDDLMPGEPLRRTLASHAITHVTLPPVVLAAMQPSDAPASLRTLVVAGEACPPSVATAWSQGRRFINAYGPTEGTVCATLYEYDRQQPGSLAASLSGSLSIGRPFANTRICILDAHGEPAPIGVTGEIHIGGIGLARGYRNLPELTAERFIAHPFDSQAGARLYRTGDLGRWQADGHIEYLGRNDTQVKLRGFRVEMGEIEARLRRHPQVKDAAVIARDVGADTRLVAYVVPQKKVALWPSVSEYYVYDALLYDSMASHTSRNRCYALAFERHLPGKVVVEIGPGPHAVLARMAIAAGANKVYAIELLERSYKAAKETVRKLGLEDRIIVLHGDATQVELPEPADYCISEIIGNIAGSEGSAVIIQSARRFLRDPSCMLPQRSLNKLAAVSLTEDQIDYAFDETAAHYVDEIFREAGQPFDLRVCVKDLPQSAILSTADTFEDLDYTRPLDAEHTHDIELTFTQTGVFTGFLTWMELYVDQDNILDTLTDQGSWIPLYFPVFADGVHVPAGSRLTAKIVRSLASNGLNPDFEVHGSIQRPDGSELVAIHAALPHQTTQFRASPFYDRLFANGVKRLPHLTPSTLRKHLQASLAEYMVPSAFVTLPAFPLTPNGKLDRQALPAPDASALAMRAYAAPQGEYEQAIAQAWQDLLGVQQVGRHDHFFELGGHSLLAARLKARLHQSLQADLPLRAIFEHPTLEAMAAVIADIAPTAVLPLVATDRSGPVPLSFAQQRLWFLDRLDPAVGAAYHIPAALQLDGKLDRDALQRALDRIIERHEILRTRIDLIAGEAVQLIDPIDLSRATFQLQEHDLRDLPATAQAEAVARLSFEEARERFDFARGPMIRGRLLQLAQDRHVLLITQHHIASDGWSIGLLVKEFCALYRAFTTGQADPLPPLTVQYADYAAWHRAWLRGDVLAQHRTFWMKHLVGAPPLLELPTDHTRRSARTYAGDVVPVALTPELSERVRQFSKRHGLTPFMTLLAAWSALMARLSNQRDVVIGSPVANRQHAATESLIGLFINTVALRLNLDEDASVAQWLDHVKQTTLAVYDHQALPFEQVVDAVQPPRNLHHNPIYQVALSLDNTPDGGALVLPDLQLTPLEQPSHSAQLDLFLSLSDNGQTIKGTLIYATDLFERHTVERFAGYWQSLLAAMLEGDTGQAITALPLLSAAERAQLTADFNPTRSPYPADTCVHQLIEQQAAQRPDAIALVYSGQSSTYGQLNASANRLAHRLIASGVRPGDRVAICTGRSPAMLIGLLAILKAGAAYIPLDPAYPRERLGFILEDAAPAVLLADAVGRAALDGSLPPSVQVLDLPNELDAEHDNSAGEYPAHDPRPQGLTSRDLAYVIYTSGSTGKPKGVMVEHRGVVNFLSSMAMAPGISADDRLLAVTSMSFDIAALEFYLPLISGAQIVLAGDGDSADPQALQRLMQDRAVTLMQATPSTWRAMLDAGWQGNAGLTMLCGGEALPTDLATALIDKGHALWNLYGPTETTIWSACARVDSLSNSIVNSHPSVTIGQPIANTRIYLLDERGQLVAPGVPGELYIAGDGVARGYLNRPELDAERFLPDPFVVDAETDARMYRTGDLARHLPDGSLIFLGRNDHQIKLRGFRIEAGEIESLLTAHSQVRAAVVLALGSEADRRLVAYVIADPLEATKESLREHLAAKLPDYMIPAAFVYMEAFPLTPNGKLDRHALPAPDESAYQRRPYEAPQGEVETLIASLWQELLGVAQVGRHDHFFELGGHSLLAVKLMERMRHAGLSADVRTLFSQPTLSALSHACSSRNADTDIVVPACAITPDTQLITPDMLPLAKLGQASIDRIVDAVPGGVGNVQDVYALAPLQEGILFHHLLEQTGDAYLFCTPFHARTRQHLDAFIAALQAVVNRHDILRTAIMWEGLEMPVQVVWRQAPLDVETLSLNPANGDISEQLQAKFDPRHYRLDLRRAPMLRLAIAHDAANQRWVALLLFHHLMDDAASMGLIATEIEALLRGDATQLAPAVPYRNHVAQARLGLSEQAHESFFREMLSDVDEPTLPFGVTDVQGDGQDLQEANLAINPDLSRRLRAQAQRLGVSPSSLFHLAWARVVGGLSGRDDVVFGTVLMGRMQGSQGSEHALGMLINTLPLRLQLDETSVRESVRLTHARLSELLVHEHAPLSLALRCSGLPASSPLFSALLNYRQAAARTSPATSLAGDHGIEFQHTRARNNYPLTMMVDDLGDNFALTTLALSDFGADRICGCMHAALQSLAHLLERTPEAPAHKLDILPEGEQSLLRLFNATHQPFPAGDLLHRLFEARAAAQPDAVAVIEQHTKPNARLTFAQLNRLANQLAQRLIELGAGPDQRIAICTERSAHMVVAVLAVLKSGAAYVPLDPAQPAERIAALLADSSPLAWVTHTALREHLSQPTLPPLPRLELDGLDDPGAAFDANPDVPGLTDRHLAYIIYTSGSTGQAKGVMVEHRSVVNFWRVLGLSTHRHVPPHATVALNAGFFFDMSIKGLSQLLSGHTLVLIPQALRASGTELLDFLAEHRVHAFDSTPSQLEGLLEAGLLERADYQPVSVLLGGEPIPAPTWKKLRHSLVTRFYNMYGPTECTVDATIGLISELGERPSIGRPIANLSVYVLDARRRPVPLGVAGEIYVGGMGVARGYLNRPDLTAERFMSDPFDAAPNARMYKTGDLARYRPDGTLEYLGRNDAQLKIRGFRIEPGEIESRLRAQPDVREAIVLARQDQDAPARLVAYLVPRDGAQRQAASLRAALAKHLPEYMIPSAFVVLDRLPLNANGKLDRAALPVPALEHLATSNYEAPQGDTEQAIAQIWQQLLGVERVGRHDRFFDLGGHSLLAVQVLSRVRRTLGIRIVLRDFFDQPTVAAIAALADGGAQSGLDSEEAAQPLIKVADRHQALPLSFAQQRLWFLDQFDRAASAAYHIPHAMRLRGTLDHAALRATLDRIVQRHENLRTTFVTVDGVPTQRIAHADVGFHLVEEDLRGMPEHEQGAIVASRGDQEARQFFDLQKGPLVRGQLLQLGAQDHVLLVTLHHIVSDAWSSGLLMREVSTLYAAFARGEPDPLPPLALQYADYAVWQRQWLQGEALEGQARFWKTHLAGAPVLLNLPTDHERPKAQSHAGGVIGFELPADLSAQLRQWSKAHDATLFMTLLAGWSVLMASLSDQDDIVVGTPVANRQRLELESIIGFFVNTLALRVQLKAKPNVAQLLEQVKTSTLAAYGHQDIPFERVVEILQPQRSMAHSPIFQVMLSLDNTPPAELSLPGLSLDPVQQSHATTQFDLSLALADRDESIRGSMQYASDLFEPATVERIADRFKAVLAAMTADAHQPVHALMASLPAFSTAARRLTQVADVATVEPMPYEAPRDGVEKVIATLWESLLGRAPIGRHDDFFALGGVSLMAVRTISQLRKQLNRTISVRELFAHPTVAGLAAAFSDEDKGPQDHPNLLPIRTSGRHRPLFLVHPVGGELQYAHALAPWLGDDHPVYGLAAPAMGDSAPLPETMDELVGLHVRAIRHVQPQGPYRIAGWSAGGLIAYEIAASLQAQHEQVEFVGVIDSAVRTLAQVAPSEAEFLLSWLPPHTPTGVLASLRALAERGDIASMLALCQAEELLPQELPRDLDADLLRSHLAVAYAIGRIVASQATRAIACEVWLFSAQDEPRADPSLGWSRLLGAHLHHIPLKGSHLSLVERPHVEALGAAIEAALVSLSAAHENPANPAGSLSARRPTSLQS